MRLALFAAVALLAPLGALAGCPPGASGPSLAQTCPGNLLVNGDFEEPNTEVIRSERYDKNNNACWGWYTRKTLPGWYAIRDDGKRCVNVDWPGKGDLEVARAALATPVSGRQYGELLPNATGTFCQDVAVKQGQKYRLTYYYGLLSNKSPKDGPLHGARTTYHSSADVVVRDAAYVPTGKEGIYPKDMQGFKLLERMVTSDWGVENQTVWKRYDLTFTAPSNKITLAFINGIRSKVCACGSLLDAVCLVPAGTTK